MVEIRKSGRVRNLNYAATRAGIAPPLAMRAMVSSTTDFLALAFDHVSTPKLAVGDTRYATSLYMYRCEAQRKRKLHDAPR